MQTAVTASVIGSRISIVREGVVTGASVLLTTAHADDVSPFYTSGTSTDPQGSCISFS